MIRTCDGFSHSPSWVRRQMLRVPVRCRAWCWSRTPTCHPWDLRRSVTGDFEGEQNGDIYHESWADYGDSSLLGGFLKFSKAWILDRVIRYGKRLGDSNRWTVHWRVLWVHQLLSSMTKKNVVFWAKQGGSSSQKCGIQGSNWKQP